MPLRLDELVRKYLAARNDPREVTAHTRAAAGSHRFPAHRVE